MRSNSRNSQISPNLTSHSGYPTFDRKSELDGQLKKIFPKFKLTHQEIEIRAFLKKYYQDLVGSCDSNIDQDPERLTLDPRVNIYRKFFESDVSQEITGFESFEDDSIIEKLPPSFVVASPSKNESSFEGDFYGSCHKNLLEFGSPEKTRAIEELKHQEINQELTKEEILEKLEKLYSYDPQKSGLASYPDVNDQLDEIILNSNPEIFAQCLQQLFDKLKKENIQSLENLQKEFSLDYIEEYQDEKSDLQRPKSHEISDDNRFDGISQLDIEIVDNNEIDNLSTTISFVSEVINQVKSVENKLQGLRSDSDHDVSQIDDLENLKKDFLRLALFGWRNALVNKSVNSIESDLIAYHGSLSSRSQQDQSQQVQSHQEQSQLFSAYYQSVDYTPVKKRIQRLGELFSRSQATERNQVDSPGRLEQERLDRFRKKVDSEGGSVSVGLGYYSRQSTGIINEELLIKRGELASPRKKISDSLLSPRHKTHQRLLSPRQGILSWLSPRGPQPDVDQKSKVHELLEDTSPFFHRSKLPAISEGGSQTPVSHERRRGGADKASSQGVSWGVRWPLFSGGSVSSSRVRPENVPSLELPKFQYSSPRTSDVIGSSLRSKEGSFGQFSSIEDDNSSIIVSARGFGNPDNYDDQANESIFIDKKLSSNNSSNSSLLSFHNLDLERSEEDNQGDNDLNDLLYSDKSRNNLRDPKQSVSEGSGRVAVCISKFEAGQSISGINITSSQVNKPPRPPALAPDPASPRTPAPALGSGSAPSPASAGALGRPPRFRAPALAPASPPASSSAQALASARATALAPASPRTPAPSLVRATAPTPAPASPRPPALAPAPASPRPPAPAPASPRPPAPAPSRDSGSAQTSARSLAPDSGSVPVSPRPPASPRSPESRSSSPPPPPPPRPQAPASDLALAQASLRSLAQASTSLPRVIEYRCAEESYQNFKSKSQTILGVLTNQTPISQANTSPQGVSPINQDEDFYTKTKDDLFDIKEKFRDTMVDHFDKDVKVRFNYQSTPENQEQKIQTEIINAILSLATNGGVLDKDKLKRFLCYLIIANKVGGVYKSKEQFKSRVDVINLFELIKSDKKIKLSYEEAKSFSKNFQELMSGKNLKTGVDQSNSIGKTIDINVGFRTKRVPIAIVEKIFKNNFQNEPTISSPSSTPSTNVSTNFVALVKEYVSRDILSC
jgi:hypothetical protein